MPRSGGGGRFTAAAIGLQSAPLAFKRVLSGNPAADQQQCTKGDAPMSEHPGPACADPTEEISIRIPCVLAELVAAHAKESGDTITNVIVEALDFFLMRQPPR